MIMSLKQRKIKLKPKIKLNHNIGIRHKPIQMLTKLQYLLKEKNLKPGLKTLTFFPKSCRCTRNCDTKSSSFTGSGSTIVTDFTPESTRFLQISAPSPLIPTSKTRDARSLKEKV